MLLNFDKEKYLRLIQEKGYATALTALHRDMERWELQTFEGRQGYQPQMWNELAEIRAFSREIWEMALRNPDNRDDAGLGKSA